MAIIYPAFLFFVVPYAVVAGNSDYIPSVTLWDFKFWEEGNLWQSAAMRKATDIHLGALHRNPLKAFHSLFVELVGKIALTWITETNTSHTTVQMILVCFLGIALYVDSIYHPPFIEPKFLSLVQDIKLIIALTMLCALLTVLLHNAGPEISSNEASSRIPLAGLLLSWLLIICHIIYKMCSLKLTRRSVRIHTMPEHGPSTPCSRQ